MPLERIQKLLQAAGFGSRHECEQLVEEGRVRVNAHVRDTLPLLIDPEVDKVTVNGKPVRAARKVYFILNKPPGYYTSDGGMDDRKSISTLVQRIRERIMPVGRTEPDCAGLVLLTNDNELARRIADPRVGPAKVYRVEAKGAIDAPALEALRHGMRLSEGRTSPMSVTVIHGDRTRTLLDITTHDRLTREIPRVLAKHGIKVKKMTRLSMGKLDIRKLPVGAVRPLLPEEIAYLKKCAESQGETSPFGAEARVSRPRRPRPGQPDRATGAKRKPARAAIKKAPEKSKAETAQNAGRPPRGRNKHGEIETHLTTDGTGVGKKKRRIIGFDD